MCIGVKRSEGLWQWSVTVLWWKQNRQVSAGLIQQRESWDRCRKEPEAVDGEVLVWQEVHWLYEASLITRPFLPLSVSHTLTLSSEDKLCLFIVLQAEVLYDFTAEPGNNELSVRRGETVTVLDQVHTTHTQKHTHTHTHTHMHAHNIYICI